VLPPDGTPEAELINLLFSNKLAPMYLLNSKTPSERKYRAGNSSSFPVANLISLFPLHCPCFQRDIKQNKVSNIGWVRHAFGTALVLFFVLCSVTQAQTHAGTFTESEIKEFIAAYNTEDPRTQVGAWQRAMPHPERNPKFAEFQAQILKVWESSEFAPYKLDDPLLLAQVQKIVEPVLRLYGRENSFKLIIIKHHIPVAMNDSGALLMISTGLIERATSDDEILGHVAHELGHDLRWQRTAQARETLELYKQGTGTKLGARQAKEELAKIELECDAFSALTLALLGRNPLPFARYLEAVERDYPDYVPPDLPPTALRARVIEGISPVTAAHVPLRASEALTNLKAVLAARL